MNQPNEKDVLQGGVQETPIVTSPETAPAETKAAAPAFVYEGLTKKIESAEELSNYTKDLEARLAAYKLEKEKQEEAQREQTMAYQFQAAPERETTPEQAEKIFQDPAGFIKGLKAEIREELDVRDQKQKARESFWDSFYQEHPELKNKDKVVKLIMNDKWAEVGNAPLHKAKEILARESIKFISELTGTTPRKESLPAGGAVTFSSTMGSAPQLQTDNAGPMTFVDELNALREQRKSARK